MRDLMAAVRHGRRGGSGAGRSVHRLLRPRRGGDPRRRQGHHELVAGTGLPRPLPGVDLDLDAMVVTDERAVTAGAAFAHIDLALTLVRRSSAELADLVSRLLVVDDRPSQSAYLAIDHLEHDDALVRDFEAYARAHLGAPIEIPVAARRSAPAGAPWSGGWRGRWACPPSPWCSGCRVGARRAPPAHHRRERRSGRPAGAATPTAPPCARCCAGGGDGHPGATAPAGGGVRRARSCWVCEVAGLVEGVLLVLGRRCPCVTTAAGTMTWRGTSGGTSSGEALPEGDQARHVDGRARPCSGCRGRSPR